MSVAAQIIFQNGIFHHWWHYFPVLCIKLINTAFLKTFMAKERNKLFQGIHETQDLNIWLIIISNSIQYTFVNVTLQVHM